MVAVNHAFSSEGSGMETNIDGLLMGERQGRRESEREEIYRYTDKQ